MNQPPRIITLTTDFGTSDVYVGIMKGVILGINPNVQVVDLTHAIPPQDIHEAAFTIYSAYPYFPKNAIHTIVVDPGVGTDRQAIVCEIEGTFFVCPDNGVLSYVLQDTRNKTEVPMKTAALQNANYFLPEISDTFHGRDIFAPVAAHLSLDIPLTNIGPSVQTLAEFPILMPQVSKNRIIGHIIKLDGFGNAITNISERTLTQEAATYEIRVGNTRLTRLNRAYAESTVGEPLAIIGSFGMLEIAINRGSAEVSLGLKWGDVVEIQWYD